MRFGLHNRRIVAELTAALMLASCAKAGTNSWIELRPGPATGPTVEITGTVHHLDLEGGVYVIRGAAGTSYNPTNLPEAFRVEGLAVEATAQRRNDLASIGMVGPLVELVRIRARPAGTASVSGPEGLLGTTWILEDLAGAGVVDRVQATLVFAKDGTVSGNASCNQFHGTATLSVDAITFSPLATTRKMCAEAVMQQETRYLETLRGANRFEITTTFLYLHAGGRTQPLRFTARKDQ